MSAALELNNVDAFYGPIQVLHGISCTILEGSFTAVLGANGVGKTTLLRAISGMIRRAGDITCFGTQISKMRTENIAGLGVAHVPDGRGTFTELTVEDNLRLGARSRRDRDNVNTDIERMYAYFPRLAERRRQQAGTLSGGEQQMLAISRALMLRPKLLLMDEPSFGLAPLVVAEIFKIIEEINNQEGITALLVEQNASLALRMADHAYLIEAGKVVLEGTGEEIRDNEGVRRAYLGY